ncbi:MAG: glycosyltransferase [Cryomorphaceae bacterium]|nr:MAG: glycosyltransferase [Cryomorphaceae bacterium]
MPVKVVYILSDLDFALAFGWVAKHLNKEAISLEVILINHDRKETELERIFLAEHIPVHKVQAANGRRAVLTVGKVRMLLRKIRPQVVHCHMRRANIIGLTAAWLARIPKRVYTRHYAMQNHVYHPQAVKADLFVNSLATHIVAPSQVVKDTLLKKEKVYPGKVLIIEHGFDIAYFAKPNELDVNNLQNELNINDNQPVVGVIARYLELKGIQYIIPAFARLLQDFPDAVLLLANARGPYQSTIRHLLKDLPAHSYREIDFEKRLAALYGCMHSFVHVPVSADIEAFGQIYVEALAAGIPSVFTLSGIAHQFVVHKHNAWVVDYRNSDAIYEGLKALCTNQSLRADLIANGQKDVESFALDTFIRKTEALYV